MASEIFRQGGNDRIHQRIGGAAGGCSNSARKQEQFIGMTRNRAM